MNDGSVQVGMTVVDGDGQRLGKVARCDPWGFEVVRGFWSPREWVVRYDEVIEVHGDEVRIARSDRDLLDLAAGRLPRGWRRDASPVPITRESGDARHG
jgi:hypothetical protein